MSKQGASNAFPRKVCCAYPRTTTVLDGLRILQKRHEFVMADGRVQSAALPSNLHARAVQMIIKYLAREYEMQQISRRRMRATMLHGHASIIIITSKTRKHGSRWACAETERLAARLNPYEHRLLARTVVTLELVTNSKMYGLAALLGSPSLVEVCMFGES